MSLRAAITVVFFVNGALFASWVSRIPAISDRVGASVGLLGLALLAPAVGAVVTMPTVGRLLPGRSSRTFIRIAVIALIAAAVLPGLATNVPELAVALMLVGSANAALDVAMNAQGIAVERHMGKPVLSSLHAAFSFGGFAGAALGAAAAALEIEPTPHLIAAAVIFGGLGLTALPPLLRDDADPDHDAPHVAWRHLPRRLPLIGAACFFTLLVEGGASDWSAKIVSADLAGSAAVGAIAYAAFSAGMGGGRLIADRLWTRWGAVALIRRSGTLAAIGLAAALSVWTVPTAILGFLALGLGLSGVVPTLFRAASEQPGVPTGVALSLVSSVGYLGFMVGPPVIGGLAELTSLRAAAMLLVASCVVVVVLAQAAASVTRRPARAAS